MSQSKYTVKQSRTVDLRTVLLSPDIRVSGGKFIDKPFQMYYSLAQATDLDIQFYC